MIKSVQFYLALIRYARVRVCVFALIGMHTYKIHKYNKSVQFAQI